MEAKYHVFVRTWWRSNPEWPDGLEPHMGRKKEIARNLSFYDAWSIAKEWNESNNLGKLSRKAEIGH